MPSLQPTSQASAACRRPAASRTNAALRRRRGVVVAVVLPVAGPRRLARAPLQPGHELLELGQRRVQQLLVEAGPAHLLLDLAPGDVRVAVLQPRVHDHVGEHALAEAVAGGREHRARVARRDPVQRAAQQRVVRQVLVGLQHQRIEEEHAELPVARPRLVRAQALERADVDEHRRRAPPLHVVGGGVLERQVRPQRAPVEVELQQRGVLEHRERPLVRVGEEGHPLVAQRARGVRGQQVRQLVELRGLRGHHAALGLQLRPQRARRECAPILQPRRAQHAVHAVRGQEHAAVGSRKEPAWRLLSAARSRPRGPISRRGRARRAASPASVYGFATASGRGASRTSR